MAQAKVKPPQRKRGPSPNARVAAKATKKGPAPAQTNAPGTQPAPVQTPPPPMNAPAPPMNAAPGAFTPQPPPMAMDQRQAYNAAPGSNAPPSLGVGLGTLTGPPQLRPQFTPIKTPMNGGMVGGNMNMGGPMQNAPMTPLPAPGPGGVDRMQNAPAPNAPPPMLGMRRGF